MPHIYRAPMRPWDDAVDASAAVERALDEGLCGLGGRLEPAPATLDDALALAQAQHDDRLARRIGRFAHAPDGALVWTRDGDGLLWLGSLVGPWRYDASAAAARVDLVHVRPCRWLPSPVTDARVPAGVHATFARGGRNWQRIHDDAAEAAAARLWREMLSQD